MKIIVLGLLAVGAAAAPQQIRCDEGPYHMKPFSLTVDDQAKTLLLSTDDADNVEITAKTVGWTFMRGFATYHRDTGILEWDARAERDYLEAIGHPGPQPYAWYQGTARCEVKR